VLGAAKPVNRMPVPTATTLDHLLYLLMASQKPVEKKNNQLLKIIIIKEKSLSPSLEEPLAFLQQSNKCWPCQALL